MPKIYQDETLQLVYDMVTVEHLTLRKIAEELCTTTDKVNLMYTAAAKRFAPKLYKKPAATKPIPVTKIQRPPAIYSNKKSLYEL